MNGIKNKVLQQGMMAALALSLSACGYEFSITKQGGGEDKDRGSNTAEHDGRSHTSDSGETKTASFNLNLPSDALSIDQDWERPEPISPPEPQNAISINCNDDARYNDVAWPFAMIELQLESSQGYVEFHLLEYYCAGSAQLQLHNLSERAEYNLVARVFGGTEYKGQTEWFTVGDRVALPMQRLGGGGYGDVIIDMFFEQDPSPHFEASLTCNFFGEGKENGCTVERIDEDPTGPVSATGICFVGRDHNDPGYGDMGGIGPGYADGSDDYGWGGPIDDPAPWEHSSCTVDVHARGLYLVTSLCNGERREQYIDMNGGHYEVMFEGCYDPYPLPDPRPTPLPPMDRPDFGDDSAPIDMEDDRDNDVADSMADSAVEPEPQQAPDQAE